MLKPGHGAKIVEAAQMDRDDALDYRMLYEKDLEGN